MKIAIVGLGYVGAALSAALSAHHEVRFFDIDPEKGKVYDQEPYRSFFERRGCPRPIGCKTLAEACDDVHFVILCLPTDYDPETHEFNLATLKGVIAEIVALDVDARIVIKSTVPVGFTDRCEFENPSFSFLFSPEFLRESHALEDVLHPSRIVVGHDAKEYLVAEEFAEMLLEAAEEKAPILLVSQAEAEAIKLFSNTYLAMRVAYFNELDSYALSNQLDAKSIIEGVCLDPRIGDGYNNPSFGYGGYCLPKDSKQLLHSFSGIPQNLIEAIVQSNETRKALLVEEILRQANDKENPVIGVYRLVMKRGGDNLRESPALEIALELKRRGATVIVYEPLLHDHDELDLENDLVAFKNKATLILANRIEEELNDCMSRVFSRDLYGRD